MLRSTGMGNTFVYRKLGKMISHQLPNPLGGSNSTVPTKIFHAHTREEYHYPEHPTPYLLVTNFGSSGDYILNGEAVRATDQLFYFTNAGDELEICFQGRQKRETLLMMFDRGIMKEAASAWLGSVDNVLEDVCGETFEGLHIPAVPFGFSRGFCRILDGIRNPDTTEEAYSAVGEGLRERVLAEFFAIWSKSIGAMRRVPALKASSRQELYKRLLIAQAFMEENVEAALSIEVIARQALLNRFYFIELFRNTFGLTPYEFLRNRKLERARDLLGAGHSVTEACLRVGYKSVGSFSHSFKNRFGYSPSAV